MNASTRKISPRTWLASIYLVVCVGVTIVLKPWFPMIRLYILMMLLCVIMQIPQLYRYIEGENKWFDPLAWPNLFGTQLAGIVIAWTFSMIPDGLVYYGWIAPQELSLFPSALEMAILAIGAGMAFWVVTYHYSESSLLEWRTTRTTFILSRLMFVVINFLSTTAVLWFNLSKYGMPHLLLLGTYVVVLGGTYFIFVDTNFTVR